MVAPAGRLAVALVTALLAVGSARPPAVAASAGQPYAALGDSYVAGTGSGSEDGSACRRSQNGYAPAFARTSGGAYGLTDFAACSGADIAAVERSQLVGLGGARLVSLTIGGNDARFGEIVVHCLVPGHGCRRDYPDEDQRIDSLEGPLRRLYGEVVAAAPEAQLLVLDYPQILREGGTCESTLWLTRDDISWFRTEWRRMNAVIHRAAAGVPRTAVVEVEDALAGHELCTAEEWAFGGRWRDPHSSFHPNALGHAALAGRLLHAAAE